MKIHEWNVIKSTVRKYFEKEEFSDNVSNFNSVNNIKGMAKWNCSEKSSDAVINMWKRIINYTEFSCAPVFFAVLCAVQKERIHKSSNI